MWQTKQSILIPIVNTYAGLFNAFCWEMFSLAPFDINIFIPNFLAILICFINIYSYFYIKLVYEKNIPADLELNLIPLQDFSKSRTQSLNLFSLPKEKELETYHQSLK